VSGTNEAIENFAFSRLCRVKNGNTKEGVETIFASAIS